MTRSRRLWFSSAPRERHLLHRPRPRNSVSDDPQEGGLAVERHADHFAHDASDEEWLAAAGAQGWIALTHNSRIRYTPNEKEAVIAYRVRLLVIVGRAPYPVLAHSFVATRERVAAFLAKHEPPFIAKVYRAPPSELEKNPDAPGTIQLWYPHA